MRGGAWEVWVRVVGTLLGGLGGGLEETFGTLLGDVWGDFGIILDMLGGNKPMSGKDALKIQKYCVC